MAHSNYMNAKAIPVAVKENPIVFDVMGGGNAMNAGSVPFGSEGKIGKALLISGTDHEIRWMMELDPITGVADGVDELADVTASYNDNAYKATQMQVTHLQKTWWQPVSWGMRLEGKGIQKGRAIRQEEADRQIRSYEDAIGTGINSANLQSSEFVGGMQSWIDDDDTNFYNIDRSLAVNSVLRGQVQAMGGTSTLKLLRTGENNAAAVGGRINLNTSDSTTYTAFQALLEGKAEATHAHEKWLKFGGTWMKYGRTVFALDPYCKADTAFGLDTRVLEIAMNKMGFRVATGQTAVRDFTKRSVNAIVTDFWFGFFVKDPAKCVRYDNTV